MTDVSQRINITESFTVVREPHKPSFIQQFTVGESVSLLTEACTVTEKNGVYNISNLIKDYAFPHSLPVVKIIFLPTGDNDYITLRQGSITGPYLDRMRSDVQESIERDWGGKRLQPVFDLANSSITTPASTRIIVVAA